MQGGGVMKITEAMVVFVAKRVKEIMDDKNYTLDEAINFLAENKNQLYLQEVTA